MGWILGIVGALLGALFGLAVMDLDRTLFGFVAGGGIGLLLGWLLALQVRVVRLGTELADLKRAGPRPAPVQAPVAPAPAPAPAPAAPRAEPAPPAAVSSAPLPVQA
ncbi:hypothetical protein, partial [Arenimonas sp.]|uniref:hypothetical protein n=1 Tax=Arenimonas sp. TaxID=1872635 RepID=UPI0025F143CE